MHVARRCAPSSLQHLGTNLVVLPATATPTAGVVYVLDSGS
jgi:hypothetical protein